MAPAAGIDLTSFRKFSLEPFREALTPGIHQAEQLIIACQKKHFGYLDTTTPSRGVKELANWLVANTALLKRPVPGTHPLNSADVIERILAGNVLPDDDFAVELAEMTEGAVLPEMFGLSPHADPAASETLSLTDASGQASEPFPPMAPTPLPTFNDAPLTAPGMLMPGVGAGRIFHPLADARVPDGFVLSGCGLQLWLDASTARSMRAALDAGLAHIDEQAIPARRQAA